MLRLKRYARPDAEGECEQQQRQVVHAECTLIHGKRVSLISLDVRIVGGPELMPLQAWPGLPELEDSRSVLKEARTQCVTSSNSWEVTNIAR